MRTETSRQTIAWFAKRADEKVLHLAPPYQRKPVWSEAGKSYLVDTVLKQLPVPEVYIHVQTSPDGVTDYTVVDGQQRVRTLIEFAQDRFELDPEVCPEWPESSFSDLSPELKQRFWSFSLVVRELHEASDADVRDLFERLNKYVFALTAQELRNARFKGPFIQSVTTLADDEFWAVHGIVSPNDIRRMLDVQFVSELLVGIIAGPQHKSETLDDYYEMYEKEFPEKSATTKLFLKAQELIAEIVPDLRHSPWRKKSNFYSLFLVLAELIRSKKARILNAAEAERVLADFGDGVEQAISKEPPSGLPREVLAYGSMVSRAASDRDRRLERARILTQLLTERAMQR